MTLKEIFSNIEVMAWEGFDWYFDVSDITHDSSKVKRGTVFVALEGTKTDGHRYIEEAFKNGASIAVIQYLSDYVIKEKIPYILVLSTRTALSRMWNTMCGDPASKLKLVGITGTNGKTTTASLIYSVLSEAGYKCGLISTVENIIDGVSYPTSMTSPDPECFFSLLSKMVSCGTEYLIMEVSSHALALEKYHGLRFKLGIFTNLSHDHLDFHSSMDDYAAAKSKLFPMCENSLFNYDDAYGRKIAECLPSGKKYFYSAKVFFTDYSAKNIILKNALGIEYSLYSCGYSFKIRSHMCGEFSVYNTLAAAAAARILGVDIVHICDGIRKLHNVKGRLEKIKTGTDFHVYIDFAHTPDAVYKVIKALYPICSQGDGRLICLFGCGGDRDKSKRPEMGEVVSRYADIAIITSDNSRTEDPEDIIADIKRGILSESKCVFIVDRRKAIEYAVNMAQKGDLILLCGKGHENSEIRRDGVHPFDEKEIVLEAIQKRKMTEKEASGE